MIKQENEGRGIGLDLRECTRQIAQADVAARNGVGVCEVVWQRQGRTCCSNALAHIARVRGERCAACIGRDACIHDV